MLGVTAMLPILTDSRIAVRPAAIEDVPAFFAAASQSSAEVGRWLPWCHDAYTQAEAQHFIAGCLDAWAQRTRFPFLIFDVGSNELLGGIGLSNLDAANRLAQLGYWVRTAQTGRGVASAAGRLVCQFAMAQAGLTRVEIAVALTNTASRRVAENLGAKLEGIARNRIVMQGVAHDAAIYSVIPGDIS